MAKSIVAIIDVPMLESQHFSTNWQEEDFYCRGSSRVTRDRIYTEVQWQDRTFTLIDTGGIEPYSEDLMLKQMKQQAEIAIETAEVIVFLVDGRRE